MWNKKWDIADSSHCNSPDIHLQDIRCAEGIATQSHGKNTLSRTEYIGYRKDRRSCLRTLNTPHIHIDYFYRTYTLYIDQATDQNSRRRQDGIPEGQKHYECSRLAD